MKQPDWAPLFEEAGHFAAFTSEPSTLASAFNSDSRCLERDVFNSVRNPHYGGGRFFQRQGGLREIIGAWNKTRCNPTVPQKLVFKILNIGLLLSLVSLVVVAVLLAIRNLRGGYSDRKGGARLAIYIFVVLMISWVFRAHHYAADEEFNLFLTGFQFALFPTVVLWLCYVALEPYVRRWWPHRIVSWSRLLAGDLRDPLVGRDVLIGAVFGVAIAVVGFVRALVPAWLGRHDLREW